MQLLGQQAHRAYVGAVSAPDTGERRHAGREVRTRSGQDAVHRLRQRDFVGGDCPAGHDAAGDQPLGIRDVAPAGAHEFRDGSADARLEVRRMHDAAARDRDDARRERGAGSYEGGHGRARTHVLAQQAHGRRQAIVRDLDARRRGEQLPLCARRVDRAEHHDFDSRVAGNLHRCPDGRNGLRLVVLDRDRAARGATGAKQDLGAQHDIGRAFLHQRVVAADPRLTLGAVQHEVCRRPRLRAGQLCGNWKRPAAEARDARIAQGFDQFLGLQGLPLERRELALGLVGAIVLDHDARSAARGSRSVADFHGANDAGDRRVHGHCRRVVRAADARSNAYALAHAHGGSGPGSAALVEGDDRKGGRRRDAQWLPGRLVLVRGQSQSRWKPAP